jgi:hypothetical protein
MGIICKCKECGEQLKAEFVPINYTRDIILVIYPCEECKARREFGEKAGD